MYLRDLEALADFAEIFSSVLRDEPAVVFLVGPLGAGKTALIRAVFTHAGVTSTVKSPSYTLLEPYPMHGREAWHLDLYRLTDPEALENLGIRDFDRTQGYLFVEWPEHGVRHLPTPDLTLTLEFSGEGRNLSFATSTPIGERICAQLAQ